MHGQGGGLCTRQGGRVWLEGIWAGNSSWESTRGSTTPHRNGCFCGGGDGPPTSSGQWKTVNESMGDFSGAYQKQITGQEGMAWIQNGVKFDGMKDGVLLDAKGKYAQFINKNTGEFYGWFIGKESLLDEAARQIKASEGAKIQWYFAEKGACDVVQDLFMDKGITEIELIFQAPK